MSKCSLRSDLRKKLEKGLVKVQPAKGTFGTGFYVGDGFILTNAHCLPRSPDPRMAGDDIVTSKISGMLSKRKVAVASVVFIDPCGDIAILESLDDQAFGKESDDFDRLISELKPVVVNLKPLLRFKKFDVHIRSIDGVWLTGEAFVAGHGGRTLAVSLRDKKVRIAAGTSGSPVFNDQGVAVGILKIGSVNTPELSALALPDYLPVWLWDRKRNGLT